jgi:hypothetical protein
MVIGSFRRLQHISAHTTHLVLVNFVQTNIDLGGSSA